MRPPSPTWPSGVLTAALAAAALACAQAPAPGNPPVHAVAATPTTFELRTVERTAGDCAPDQEPCAHFLARYPVITGGVRPPVQDALNRAIVALVAGRSAVFQEGDPAPPATVEEAAEHFLANWELWRGEFPPDAPAAYARWTDERRMEVLYADHQVLSVELALYAFTGGAHPNSFAALQSLLLATGEPLALEDLLAPGAAERLDALGERHFRREREIAEGETFEAAGFWFEDERFHLTDNFAVTAEGLLFVFNPYEVAPYVFGPTRITLPWSELRGLLRPDAPLAPAAAASRRRAATLD